MGTIGEPHVVDGDEDGIRYSCDFAMNGDIIAIWRNNNCLEKFANMKNETWMQYGGDIPNPDNKKWSQR